MQMTDEDLWDACSNCVRVFNNKPDPDYEALRDGLEDWFFETRGERLPDGWGDRTENNVREYVSLCFEMKKLYLILAVDTIYYSSWDTDKIQILALLVMKALEAYFGKEYC